MSDIKELIKSVLMGETSLDSLGDDDFCDVVEVMELMKAKFISPEQQKNNKAKAIRNANKDAFYQANIEVKDKKPAAQDKPKKVGHLTVAKEEMAKPGVGGYMAPDGQLTTSPMGKGEKRVSKVTQTMREDIYGKRGKHDPEMESREVLKTHANGQWKIEKEERTLDYSKINRRPNAEESEANAPTIDYSKLKTPPAAEKPWVGSIERRDAALANAGMSPMRQSKKRFK